MLPSRAEALRLQLSQVLHGGHIGATQRDDLLRILPQKPFGCLMLSYWFIWFIDGCCYGNGGNGNMAGWKIYGSYMVNVWFIDNLWKHKLPYRECL